MNFSRISNEHLLGRLIRLPLRLVPSGMPILILQGRLRGKRWIVGSSNHGCWLGSYEYEKRRLFETTIQEDSVVFDIGANVGFYTLLASVLVGSRGQVVAFEPVPGNVRLLKRHLYLNHISNVRVINAAVAEAGGISKFAEGLNNSMGQISANGTLDVAVVSLDEVISVYRLPMPDYLKIDVEGAEYHVLQGAQSILRHRHPTIFLATHSPEIHRRCCSYLNDYGYTVRAINGGDVSHCDEVIAT